MSPQDTPSATFERPGYKFLRSQEDWSGLAGRDRSQTGDLFDPIKYIPLSDDGEIWVSMGGHVRYRFEDWSNFGFGDPNDDDFSLLRVLLHADVHVGDNLRIYLEGKTAQATNRDLPGGRRAGLDVDSIALEQAFVDVRIPLENNVSLTLRIGRQALLFGKQRLVSPLPWGNVLRRWDGISGILTLNHGWKATLFATQFAPVRKYQFNQADASNRLSGIYATGSSPLTNAKLDVYWLYLDRESAAFNGTSGGEDRQTFGGRIWGKVSDLSLDYDIEAAYQTGVLGAGDINAFMFAGELGYSRKDLPGNPRVHVGFDYASGDDAPGGDVETFNQLFPLGHAYLGYVDAIGRQNIIDTSMGITLKPTAKLVVKATGHFFWQAQDSDAVYNPGGGVLRAPVAGSDDEIGQELDITAKYKFNRHLFGVLGYSHFFAGKRLDVAGSANKDIDFTYLIMQYTF